MGYLFLSLALAGGLIKGFAGKKISGNVDGFKDCIFVNLLRVLFCCIIGFLLICISGDFSSLTLSLSNLPIYIFSAISMSAFCVSYMFAYKVSAYMYLSIFGMLGSIFTCFLGSIVYNEQIKLNKWFGMVILLIAVLIMSKYNKEIIRKQNKAAIIILIIGAISSSLADFSQKIYMNEIGENPKVFNFYTYLFATLLLLILLPFAKGKLRKESGESLYNKKYIAICGIISLGLYLNSYSKTFAASYLTTAEIYPVLQGANLIASAILASILLKEKITNKSVLGMLCAFLGLIIMNVL